MRRRIDEHLPYNSTYRRYLDFRFERIYRGLPGYVSRGVGLRPFVPAEARRGGLSARKDSHAITKQYRTALDALHAAGQITQDQAFALGNCRPAIGRVTPETRCCGMANLCVHCWTRRAVDFWARMDRAAFPPEVDGVRPDRADVDLVLAIRRLTPSDLRPYRDAGATLATIVAERVARVAPKVGPALLGSRAVDRHRAEAAIGLRWSVEALVVEPLYGAEAGWSLEVRRLFAVEPGGAFELPGVEAVRVATPTRRQLARAAIRLGRYPRGLLVGPGGGAPPAKMLDRYHDAVFRRRLWAAYGGLPPAQ